MKSKASHTKIFLFTLSCNGSCCLLRGWGSSARALFSEERQTDFTLSIKFDMLQDLPREKEAIRIQIVQPELFYAKSHEVERINEEV